MRKLPIFLAFILAGCGGDGGGYQVTPQPVQHVPEISDLVLSPDSALYMEGDGSVQVTAEFAFTDLGQDIQTLQVEMSDGTSLAIPVAELIDAVSGTLTKAFNVTTADADGCMVEIWVVDMAGQSSNHLSTKFDVIQHVPEISNLKLSPDSALYMEGDGSVVVTAEITFMDVGQDIQALWIRVPDGSSMELSESLTHKTGVLTEDFALPTNQVGVFPVEIWLVDRAGNSSVHRTAYFSVIGDVQSSAGGIWTGTVSNDLTGRSFEISGVVTEDNVEGRFVIDGGTLFILRDITVAGVEIVATISVWTRPDAVFIPGTYTASGVMTGSLVERTHIHGEWSLDTGEVGTVTLEYDELYERGSDIARLVGIWKGSWGTIYTVDALGEIFGQDENGCVYSGPVELIDPLYNVYRVTMIGGCLAWFGSGFGVLGDELDTDDAFVLMLGEGWFMADTWQRQ